MSAGGTFAQLLRAGHLSGKAARFFLDLSEVERRDMGGILIEGLGGGPAQDLGLPLSPLGSRGVTPILAPARSESFGFVAT